MSHVSVRMRFGDVLGAPMRFGDVLGAPMLLLPWSSSGLPSAATLARTLVSGSAAEEEDGEGKSAAGKVGATEPRGGVRYPGTCCC